MSGKSLRYGSLLAVLVMVGCSQSRSSLQMDSDSRMPFLNLAVPISHNDRDAAPAVIDAHTERGNEPSAIQSADFEAEAASDRASRWTGWIDKLRAPKSIPLPRTDINDDGEIIEMSESELSSIHEF